jgi:hypothetical protein
MSYEVISADGAGGQITSSAGMLELLEAAGPSLTAFVTAGEADAELGKAIQREVAGDPNLAYVGELLNGEAPYVLTNGVQEEDDG